MKHIFKWVIRLSPIQIGLFLLLVPFLSGLLGALISLLSVFLDFEFEVPLFQIGLFIMHAIFMLWIWTISVVINAKTIAIPSLLFKISFFFYLIYRVTDFLISLQLDVFQKGWYFDTNTIDLIEMATAIYGLFVMLAYLYLAFFTGKVLTNTTLSKPQELMQTLPKFLAVFVFPIGIPLLQSQIQNYLKDNALFGFENAYDKYTGNYTSQANHKIEEEDKNEPEELIIEESVIQKEDLDKEDPRRFMPK